jgi:hypothetical protein
MVMSRKITLVLLTLVFFTGFCLQISQALEATYNDVDCLENGFIISAPTEWETKKDTFGTHLMMFASHSASSCNYRENVSVMSETPDKQLTLDEFVENLVELTRQRTEDFTLVDLKNETVNGFDARKIVMTDSIRDLKLKTSIYVIKKDDKVFIVTSTALVNSYDRFSPLFEKIAHSLRIK